MKQIKDVIKELLFPRRCPICDEVLPVLAVWETSRLICPACRRMVERVKIKEPVCKKCGKPIAEKRQEYCTDCERKKHEFVQGKTVFAYQDPMRESLYRFKYSNRREYADFYAEEALRHYEKWILYRKIQVIVPVQLGSPQGFVAADALLFDVAPTIIAPTTITNIVAKIICTFLVNSNFFIRILLYNDFYIYDNTFPTSKQ